jgi:hypothetical protein
MRDSLSVRTSTRRRATRRANGRANRACGRQLRQWNARAAGNHHVLELRQRDLHLRDGVPLSGSAFRSGPEQFNLRRPRPAKAPILRHRRAQRGADEHFPAGWRIAERQLGAGVELQKRAPWQHLSPQDASPKAGMWRSSPCP